MLRQNLSFLAALPLLVAALPACTGLNTPEVCSKNVVVTGYWPPTNEMLRQFSTQGAQNPGGWQGRNWRNSGYDIYAFFPEFPPDGDPTNDTIGDAGSVGDAQSDLRVDYQDTSLDFWRIVETYKPIALVTTSRGGDIEWELEAIEGGHGEPTQSPELDWISDSNGLTHPTRDSIDQRSWHAITKYRTGVTLSSKLPMTEIMLAVTHLDAQIDDIGTSGNYLSGFMGLHGLYFNATHSYNQIAGHIHVGRHVKVKDATRAFEQTLEVVLRKLDKPACQ